jgi:hypothetical protein
MKKFWMMGGAVIAVAVTAMVWNSGPVRSSENLLGKAQSEFAAKARDALIQRQMGQTPPAPVVVAAPKSETTPAPYVVASLGPVAAPTVATRETRFEARSRAPEPQVAVEPQVTVEPQTVTVAPVAPIAAQEIVSSAAPSAPAAEETPAPKMQLAALPAEPKISEAPQQIAVAPVSEVAKVEAPAVTQTYDEPKREFKAERKPRHVKRERRTNDDGYRSERSERYDRADRYERSERSYRAERRAPRYVSGYNLDALRARSPELAAAISRYMN